MNFIMNMTGMVTYFLRENYYIDYVCNKNSGREERIDFEERRITKSQVIYTFTKTGLNIYDGISTLKKKK